MKSAEFEEREFEAPLYNQLGQGNRSVWSPGQVFEGHVGLDYSIFVTDDLIFRINGISSHLSGAMMSRYHWPRSWFRRVAGRNRFPNFKLNLFIQAKRPEWSSHPSATLKRHGFKGPYWKFSIVEEQQAALENVASKLDRRALVIYAAPVFHTHKDLYRHTTKGTIIQQSTFPSVAKMHNHSAWYYNQPGAAGVANAEFEAIAEPSLEERIQVIMKSESGKGYSADEWKIELQTLANNLKDALRGEQLAEFSRTAKFFDLSAEIEREFHDLPKADAIIPYLTVRAFCDVHRVDWYLIG